MVAACAELGADRDHERSGRGGCRAAYDAAGIRRYASESAAAAAGGADSEDVLDWRANEVAALLDLSVAAVNSALQRARARLPADHDGVVEPQQARQRELLDRYVAAFENADVAGLVAVLTEDATFEMPPLPTWFRGRAAIGGFLGARMRELGKGSVVRTSANGQPAVALYLGSHDAKRLHSLHVLTIAAHGVSRVVSFQDIGAVRRFDLPASRSSTPDAVGGKMKGVKR